MRPRAQLFKYNPRRTQGPGGEIGRRKGLEPLSTRTGNPRVNGVKFGGTAARRGGCNTELSPTVEELAASTACRSGKCRDLTAPA